MCMSVPFLRPLLSAFLLSPFSCLYSGTANAPHASTFAGFIRTKCSSTASTSAARARRGPTLRPRPRERLPVSQIFIVDGCGVGDFRTKLRRFGIFTTGGSFLPLAVGGAGDCAPTYVDLLFSSPDVWSPHGVGLVSARLTLSLASDDAFLLIFTMGVFSGSMTGGGWSVAS